jgi:DNA-binding NarL/FixJ family response regulator
VKEDHTVEKLKILVADDHAVVRDGLKALINAEADMEVIGEAKDGRVAVQKIIELRPDIAIIDISMPELNGIQATERIKRECPEVKVLALTVHPEKGYLDQLLRVGVSGYVLKLSAADELIEAIRSVANGETYVDRELASRITTDYLRKQSAGGESGAGVLTDREEQVLRLVAEGYSNKEIANQLNISVKTVETHKANFMEKLEFKSRTDVVRYAIERGWLHGT